MKPLLIKSEEDIPRNYTGVVEFKNGTKQWRLDGHLHREDGPAVEHSDGTKEWYLNGKLHREDGPAYEYTDGYYTGGYKQWWILGSYVADNNHFSRLRNNCIVVERGIPTNNMFGKLKLTQAKFLTANGTMFYCDNLPGLDIDIDT
jgi:hypothetical protein